MEFKNTDEWLGYIIHETHGTVKNGRAYIDRQELINVLEKTPVEFRNDEITKGLIELSKKSNDDYIFIGDLYNEETFTLESSIFKDFGITKSVEAEQGIDIWLAEAQRQFECIYKYQSEPGFMNSINELELAENELRELNRFFNSGVTDSYILNYESPDFVEVNELHQTYKDLITGSYDNFFDKNIGENLELSQLQFYAKKFWFRAARVQAFLWLKGYLENVVKTGNFNDFRIKPLDNSNDKNGHGFTVHNKEKTTPALYEKLVEHGLIEPESLDEFKEAFENGNGFIVWLGNGTHGQGVNSLIYLIAKMKSDGLIKNKDFIKITSLVFKDVNQKLFKHSSLTASKSNNKNVPPPESKTIDIIVTEIKNL